MRYALQTRRVCRLPNVRHKHVEALQVVINMLSPPETLAEAVQRIAHAVGGGQDDDDDDIIMGDTLPANLRDPLSNLRVQRGLRVCGGKNLQPFDMDFFLDSAKRSRKWQCPISCALPILVPLFPTSLPLGILHAELLSTTCRFPWCGRWGRLTRGINTKNIKLLRISSR